MTPTMMTLAHISSEQHTVAFYFLAFSLLRILISIELAQMTEQFLFSQS